jgi:PAS domain S-box-containing protein
MSTLEDNTLHYQLMFSENMTVMLIVDPVDGTIIDASLGACQYYGYSLSEITAMRIFDVNIMSKAEVTAEMQQATENHKNHFYYRHQLASGEIRDVEVYSSPIPMNGKTFLYSVIHDITKRRQAEKTNREQAQLLDQIFKHSLDSIVVLDKDYNFIRVSETYAKAGQRDSSEFPGHNHFDFYPSNFKDEADEAKKGKQIYQRSARPFVYPDHPEWGTTYWDIGFVPILDKEGEIELFLFTLKDVTEHKRSEFRLQESEEKYRLAMEVTKDGLWDWDVASGSVYYSSGWGHLLGDEDVESSYSTWEDRIHPADKPLVLDSLNLHLTGESATWKVEHRLHNANGAWVWVLGRGQVVKRDQEEKPMRMVGTMTDITNQKQIEEELRYHRDHLQELVEEQTADLLSAKNAAEVMNQAKSEFLANMSHELRTPMHAILCFADLGEKKIDTAPKEKLLRYFSMIHDSGSRLMLLLNGLLDLSKLEAGQMQLEVGIHDLKTVVETAMTELTELAKKKSLKLELLPRAVSTTAEFDSNKIHQVVYNLLSNAIKFTSESKHITVSFSEAELPIKHLQTETGMAPAISLTVKDEGMGIPEEELERVFDKFVQSSATNTGAGGTGLGLAICKEIISIHHGTIQAANNPAGGGIFSFTIPRAHQRDHVNDF